MDTKLLNHKGFYALMVFCAVFHPWRSGHLAMLRTDPLATLNPNTIPCDNLDTAPVTAIYNVFLDGLSTRFPHFVGSMVFSIDIRDQSHHNFWSVEIVDMLNEVRAYFEANAQAANAEAIPPIDLMEILQKRMEQQE